jgi:hypothetical protein
VPDPPRPKLPLAARVDREPTLVRGFPFAPGTKQPLPPAQPNRDRMPSHGDLEAVTEIQRHPSRQDERSEATETPVPPVGPRRERLQERQPPRSVTPTPYERPENLPAIRREAERHGDRYEPAPVSPVSLRPDALDEKGIQVRWSTLKKWAPWVLVTLGFGGSTTGGYFVGLRQARAEIADLQAAAEDHEKRLAKRERAAATLSKSVDAIDDSLKSEAQERRSDVGKLRDEVKDIRENMPRVEGLRPR